MVPPGRTPEQSRTQQIILLRQAPADELERAAADNTRDWFHDVVLDEDYATGFALQRGLAALGSTEFTFGRNEPGVQHFHRVVDDLLAGAGWSPGRVGAASS